MLIRLAYDLIEPNNNIWKFPQKLWSFVNLSIIKITGQEREFLFCVDAIDCLVDTIFDAIEQEDITHQEVLSDSLREVRDFWSALQDFRQRVDLESIDDNTFENLRDKSPRREVDL